jgi:hypothetical protein
MPPSIALSHDISYAFCPEGDGSAVDVCVVDRAAYCKSTTFILADRQGVSALWWAPPHVLCVVFSWAFAKL